MIRFHCAVDQMHTFPSIKPYTTPYISLLGSKFQVTKNHQKSYPFNNQYTSSYQFHGK